MPLAFWSNRGGAALKSRLKTRPENVSKIVLASCILHSIVRRIEPDNNIEEPMETQNPHNSLGADVSGRPPQEALDVKT